MPEDFKWLDNTHPAYAECHPKWDYAHTVFVSDVTKLRTDEYLVQARQGEHELAFEERCKQADFTPYFGSFVTSQRGRVMQIESSPRFSRSFGDVLGRTDDPGSYAARLWENADGTGANYLTVMEKALTNLELYGTARAPALWGLVEGDAEQDSVYLRALPPQAVTNWGTTSKGEPFAIVRSTITTNATPEEPWMNEPKPGLRWHLYTPAGFRVFEEVETATAGGGTEKKRSEVTALHIAANGLAADGTSARYGSSGDDALVYTDGDRPILPIYPVYLPLEYMVAFALANKNIVIFNAESEADSAERNNCMPMFQFVGDNDEWDAAVARRKDGSNWIQSNPEFNRDHSYIALPTEAATRRRDTIKEKTDAFDRNAFTMFSGALQQQAQTATEVTRRVSEEGAFLGSLVTGLDEFELGGFLRMEQAAEPAQTDGRGTYALTHVDDTGAEKAGRPRSFSGTDDFSERIANYLGKDAPMPPTRSGLISLMTAKYRADGVQPSDEGTELEDEIADAVDQYLLTSVYEANPELGINQARQIVAGDRAALTRTDATNGLEQ